MDNLRRLSSAWLLYADDNRGAVVRNLSGSETVAPVAGNLSWVTGWMDWTVATANTNVAYLTSPSASLLAPYAGRNPSIFKCPADTFMGAAQLAKGWSGRVRSYSMNYFVGTVNPQTGLFPEYLSINRVSDFRKLAPGQVLLFEEEHPDSLNDPVIIASMSTPQWLDMPASYHDGAAWFAFADGHVEFRVWQSSRTLVPIRFGIPIFPAVPSNDLDYLWVKSRTTERR